MTRQQFACAARQYAALEGTDTVLAFGLEATATVNEERRRTGVDRSIDSDIGIGHCRISGPGPMVTAATEAGGERQEKRNPQSHDVLPCLSSRASVRWYRQSQCCACGPRGRDAVSYT